MWIWPWLESLWRDACYAIRTLRRHPSFTVTAAATLVLALGLNVSAFTIVNALLLRPWPAADPHSLAMVFAKAPSHRGGVRGFSLAEYAFLRDHARSFRGLGR